MKSERSVWRKAYEEEEEVKSAEAAARYLPGQYLPPHGLSPWPSLPGNVLCNILSTKTE